MATKLTLSTPPLEILATLKEEYPKSKRWYHKQRGGEERSSKLVQDIMNKQGDYGQGGVTDYVEYNPKSGNKWICFEKVVRIPQTIHFYVDYEAFVFFETEGSVGCFYPVCDGDNHCVEGALVFPSHAFQRYCDDERRLGVMNGEKTIINFLHENHIYQEKTYIDDDGTHRLYLRLHGCIGLGIVLNEDPEVYEVRTFITDAMMTAKQIEDTAELCSRYDEQLKAKFKAPDECVEVYETQSRQRKTIELIKELMRDLVDANLPVKSEIYDELATEHCRCLALIMLILSQATGNEYHFDSFPIDKYIVGRLLEIYIIKVTYRKASECVRPFAEVAMKVAEHHGIETNFEAVYNCVLENYDDTTIKKTKQSNQLNKGNSMNQKSTTMFKNLLSRCGITKKFSKYSEGIDNNTDRYLDSVESLYVLSRVYVFINDIKDKENFIKADRLWIQCVVENGFCNELKKYVDEYGKEQVIAAINHLIDHDRWQTPEGKKALKVKQPTNYDGLKEIPDAVDSVLSYKPELMERFEDAETQPAESAAPLSGDASPETEQKPEGPKDYNIWGKYGMAKASAEEFLEGAERLKQIAENILIYMTEEDPASLFNEEYEKLQYESKKEKEDLLFKISELRDEIDQMKSGQSKELKGLKKEVEEKVAQIKVSQQKLHEAEKKAKAQEEAAYQARKERAALATENDNLKAEQRKLQAELDVLREKAKESELPRKKIIRASVFTTEYGFGPKTMAIIQKVLDKNGIYLDMNK